MADKNTLELTESNFQEKVLDQTGPVLVDFWADWCPPCKAIGPVIDQLADDYAGRAVIGKVDVDANPALAKRYDIRSIPALVIFRDGQVVKQLAGYQSKEALAEAIEASNDVKTA